MIWFKKKMTGTNGTEERNIKVPQGLWVKCEHCGEIIYKKEVERNFDVCPKCSYHFRISAKARLDMILDEGSFVEHDADMEPTDPLAFMDLRKYKERLKTTKKTSPHKDAFISGEGAINSKRVMIGAFEFTFMGGSMGSVVGEKIARLIERAIDTRTPVIIISSSGGARMQEGMFSLMQMAKTSAVLA
ncbi:MAG: acetyl-CoA carboxylase carboxyltransferase subunit beta, partial [Thermodesulfobacteriota bacterium]